MTQTLPADQRRSLYNVWLQMKYRCLKPSHPSFPNYGGRGITVCPAWIVSFEQWAADMGPRPDGGSLDRIDNDGNYEPGNCRWASRAQQNRNYRRNIWIDYQGQRMTLKDAAKAAGISYLTLAQRYHAGWSADRLFSPPDKRNAPRDNPTHSKAIALGLHPNVVNRRIQRGWPEEMWYAPSGTRLFSRQGKPI